MRSPPPLKIISIFHIYNERRFLPAQLKHQAERGLQADIIDNQLTDGGAEERVNQTKKGLISIGLLDQATFLNHSERSFYEALLDCDTDFYQTVSKQITYWIAEHNPSQVFCDAVEFYNPVHDIALPLVISAVKQKEIEILEVPLIYQDKSQATGFSLQQVRRSRLQDEFNVKLSDQEVANKINARDTIYTELSQQMGALLTKVSSEQARSEYAAQHKHPLSIRNENEPLRYEERAELLFSQGLVRAPIRYMENYVPIVTDLLAEKIS